MPSFFNPREEITQHERNLPHWQQGDVTQFVTWRLADSLPVVKWKAWEEEFEIWLRFHPAPWDEKTQTEYNEGFGLRVEAWLDAGHGECLLRQPKSAAIVASALEHFDEDRYRLLGYVIMPNHVHVLFTPLWNHALSAILHSWKSFTAKALNRHLGKTGTVWQDEYWDTMVRSEKHLLHLVQYLESNPRKACLKENEFLLKQWGMGAPPVLTENTGKMPMPHFSK